MVDLTPYNTLHLPAHADSLVEITSPDQLKAEIQNGTFTKPFMFLGHGANILFTKDFPGTVLVNHTKGKKVSETENDIEIEFASGEDWIEAVDWTVSQGWSGMENMALIPGTLGAAAVGNIAAYGQNFSDIFVSLTAINLSTGKSEVFDRDACHFVYRSSIFKKELKNKYFICSVTIKLTKRFIPEDSYVDVGKRESVASELAQIAKPPYTAQNVRDAVVRLRTRKLPDWNQVGTAGSFFKNPLVTKDQLVEIEKLCPGIQYYPADKLRYSLAEVQQSLNLDNKVKLPAGWLLDKAGWRGKRLGNVGTAENQALCVVNFGNATGQDLYGFCEQMRADVKQKYGINLEYEVVIV